MKKLEDVKAHRPCDEFGDKEVKFKYFKIDHADKSNEIGEKIFKQTFGHTLQTLANKTTNTINKEENQIIVNNINKNEEKIGQECETSYGLDWVIQPNSQRIDLIDANQLILNFNETIQLDLVWKYKNQKKEWMILIGGNSHKLLNTLCNYEKLIFFLCMY